MNHTKIFLNNLFNSFGKNQIPYVVLHDYEKLPDFAPSDIDIAISPEATMILDELVEQAVFTSQLIFIQKMHYDIPNCYYYVIGSIKYRKALIRIDFMIDGIGVNTYRLTSQSLIRDRQKFNNFFIPSIGNQVSYLLLKRAVKKQIDEKSFKKIISFFNESSDNVETTLIMYFNRPIVEQIIATLSLNDIHQLRGILPLILTGLKTKKKYFAKIYWHSKRFICRTFYKTGMVVAFVAPDGSGKTTVINETLKELPIYFRNTKKLHLRPGLFPQLSHIFKTKEAINKEDYSNPHNNNKRSVFSSTIRWAYYLLDYILGYYTKLLPLKIKSTIILMDRYYYDVLIDPLRYGYNLPQWLIKSVFPIIPKPELTIYLDNAPQNIYQRKKELSIQEIRRQICLWRNLIHKLPNSHIVSTDQSIKNVTEEVFSLIINRRSELTKISMKLIPLETKYISNIASVKDYYVLPSIKNTKWIFPANNILATRSWRLYQPDSTMGKIKKYVYTFITFIGLLNIVSKRISIKKNIISESLAERLNIIYKQKDIAMAVSSGTPGPFQKNTIMLLSKKGQVLGYVKISNKQKAIQSIKHEANFLEAVKHLNSNLHKNIQITIPSCIEYGQLNSFSYLIISPPGEGYKKGRRTFSQEHFEILKKLKKHNCTIGPLNSSTYFAFLKNKINDYPISFRKMLFQSIEYLEKEIGNNDLLFGLSHGDFVPWNMLWKESSIFIFDWESAAFNRPVGFDLMHFLFQTNYLLKKIKGANLVKTVLSEGVVYYGSLVEDKINTPVDIKFLFLLYLINMAVIEDRFKILSPEAVQRRVIIQGLIEK